MRFDWMEECDWAYHNIVHDISWDPILSLPDFALPFDLNTDDSNYGTGAVLCQRNAEQSAHKQLHMVDYHSYTFNKTKLKHKTETGALVQLNCQVHPLLF